MEILFPFLVAGLGMVGAGLVLDIVQHWKVFEEIHELFILVPALLGLKGNLEMTLASRLSTQVSLHILREINFVDSRSAKTAIFAILGAVNFVHLVNISLQKVQKFLKYQKSEPLNLLKWQNSHFYDLQNWFHVKSVDDRKL